LIFTKDLIRELNSITIEKIIDDSDNYYTTSLGLYNYTKDKLTKANSLQIEFDIAVSGVLQNLIIPHGVDWNYLLTVGDFVTLIDGEDDIKTDDERGLRIIEIDYSPCEFNISKITFSNNEKAGDDLKGASNIGHAMNTNNNFINNYKPTIQNSVSVNDYINTMLTDGLDTSATAIRSRAGRVKYDQTEAGMFIEDALDPNKQIYLGSAIIALSSDRFLTTKVAITDEGITADYLISRIILGKQLYVCNSNSDGSISDEFYIGNMDKITHEPDSNGENFGLRIAENSVERIFLGVEKDLDGIRHAKLRLTSKDGKKVVLSDEGILQRDQNTVWQNVSNGFPMETYIDLDEGVSRVEKATLKLRLGRYRGFTKDITTSNTTTTSGASSRITSGASSKSTSTSESSGGFDLSRTTENNNISTDLYGGMTENATQWGDGQALINAINSNDSARVNTIFQSHTHMLSHFGLVHGHYVEIKQNPHYHSVNLEHNHNMEHTHQLDLNLQTTVETGIRLFEMASNVKVIINGQIVVTNINSDLNIDITTYLLLNTDNKIEIHSETNGYIGLSTTCKYFSRF
jgi:hypothetical protein